MLFADQQTIVFIGDSITDCGRRDLAAPYGNGYVNIVRNLLLARYPERRLHIRNRGISANTTRDLAARWRRDVLDERPDWLVILIGINDVWRSFDSFGIGAVALEDYSATLRDLLAQTRAANNPRLVLMEPYMIEANREQPMRRQMDRYAAALQPLAAEYDALLVQTQAAFERVLHYSTPADWSSDQIHPNLAGHTLIALSLLSALGFVV